MKNTLYLLRHAHIDSKGALIGQTDISLSDKGKKQAQYWHKKLQNIHFDAVWVSPLQRAVETANIILENTISYSTEKATQNTNTKNTNTQKNFIQTVPAFTEISLGSWEGKSKAWVQENDAQRWMERGENMECIAPPRGENFADLQNRVIPAFFDICAQAKKHSCSMIIAHQAVNRVILAQILGIPLTKVQSITQDYACLNIFDITHYFQIMNYEVCPI